MLLGPDSFAFGAGMISRFFHDADGGIRAALVCWCVAIAAFAIFRVPRRIVLACLIIASVAVGFANMLVEAVPAGPAVRNRSPATPAALASERGILMERAGRGVPHSAK